jgi:hypothetical protein
MPTFQDYSKFEIICFAKLTPGRKNITVIGLNLVIASVAIDPRMAVIWVQVGKNIVKDVLLDGKYGVNIMVNKLWKQLPNLKSPSYTLQMANQTITKLVGLIKDFKIQIHGIPYTTMFIVMKNNVLDFNYSMLLGQPWLHNAHVTHDWGNNIITIEGNGIVQTISITKHLDSNTKHLKVLLCYDLMESVIDEKKEIFFIAKPYLFTITKTEKFQCCIFWCKSWYKRSYVQLLTL